MIRDGHDPASLKEACKLLKEGHVVAFPTETVYGLGACAFMDRAVRRVYEIKNRPTSDPLILHLHSESQLPELVSQVPQDARALMRSFWPGPLTIIFKKSAKVSGLLTADLDTVAIRIPKHEIALQLLKAVNEPIAAPSANRFQRISPTTAQAVFEELGEQVPLILDGGLCERGIESTVVSVVDGLKVLRLGAVPVEDIELALGKKIEVQARATHESQAQVSPGLLSFHYAPRTRLAFCEDLSKATEFLKEKNVGVIVFDRVHLEKMPNDVRIFVLSNSGDITEAARNLFQTLRLADASELDIIVAIKVPDVGLGRAINDRLRKAHHI